MTALADYCPSTTAVPTQPRFQLWREESRAGELWQGSFEKRRRAEKELVGAFADMREALLRTLRCLLGNLQDAEDALQVGFLRCWQARATAGNLLNLRAWVWRVTVNAGKDIRRRLRRPLRAADTTQPSHQLCPSEILIEQEQRERLRAALLQLSPREKEVFLLRQNGDLTYKEIGEYLGIPTGSAKTFMRRAIGKLREQFDESEPEMNPG